MQLKYLPGKVEFFQIVLILRVFVRSKAEVHSILLVLYFSYNSEVAPDPPVERKTYKDTFATSTSTSTPGSQSTLTSATDDMKRRETETEEIDTSKVCIKTIK